MLVATLEKAGEEGLDPTAYPLGEIERLLAASRPDALDKLRQILTVATLDYATDSLLGRTDPSRSDSEWHIRAPRPDPFEVLEKASAAGELDAFLRSLAPSHRHFRRLRQALARYRAIAERGGWPVLSRGTALGKGMRGPRVRVLRRRLAISGDLADAEDGSEIFGEATEAAVTRVQVRHGLVPDGIAGSELRHSQELTPPLLFGSDPFVNSSAV